MAPEAPQAEGLCHAGNLDLGVQRKGFRQGDWDTNHSLRHVELDCVTYRLPVIVYSSKQWLL